MSMQTKSEMTTVQTETSKNPKMVQRRENRPGSGVVIQHFWIQRSECPGDRLGPLGVALKTLEIQRAPARNAL